MYWELSSNQEFTFVPHDLWNNLPVTLLKYGIASICSGARMRHYAAAARWLFYAARCHHHHLVHLGEYFHGDHFWKILAFSRRNLRLFTFFRIPSALGGHALLQRYSAYERSRDWGNAKCDGFAYRNMYALFHAWLIGCANKKNIAPSQKKNQDTLWKF